MSDNSNPTQESGAGRVTDDTGHKLLTAIEQLRDEGRERDKKTDARFERIESQLVDVREELVEVRDEGRTNAKQIAEQAAALTRVASGAAQAVDIALEAKRHAANSTDEATKIVQSALQIHGASIAMTVDAAVNKAVEPIKSDIAELRKIDQATSDTLRAQDETLAKQDEVLEEHGKKIGGIDTKVDAVVKSVGTIANGVSKLVTWRSHWAIKAAAIAGIAIGASVYGYCNAQKAGPSQIHTNAAPSIGAPHAPDAGVVDDN